VRELSRQGTVTAAAAALGKSQSTLSHALDRLRRHYRDPLFVPAGKQLTRTPLGARLVAMLAEFAILFLMVLLPQLVTVPAKWLGG
jgi:DNA-binding transcriptional LysR family regulator